MLGTGAFLYPGLLSQREMESAGMGEWGRLNVKTTSEWTQDRSTGLQKAPAWMTVLWTPTFPGTWDDT